MRKTLIQTLLAAFCAILATAPLEGGGVMLIGMRNAMHAGGRWENPYITDGLVAMWDGEWNVAGGVHDANAPVLVDLTGHGYGLSWADGTAGVSFGQNYLELLNSYPSATKITSVAVDVLAATTVETVASYDWRYTDNQANLQGALWFFRTVFPQSRFFKHIITEYTDGKLRAYNGTGKNVPSNTVSSVSVAGPNRVGGGGCTTYFINGVETWAQCDHIGNESPSSEIALHRSARADAKLYNCRFYSRALTADEVAANYAIDKARFNLP